MRKKTKPQKPLYKDSSMEKIAIFPGSFDPFTKGHESLLRRGLTLFDRIIIGVGINEYKRMEQSTEKRIAALRKLFAEDERIQVEGYSDLTVDFAARHHARFILRGIRSIKDYEYEMNIADLNRRLTGRRCAGVKLRAGGQCHGISSIWNVTGADKKCRTPQIQSAVRRGGGSALHRFYYDNMSA